jgi:hypothetical protein
MQLTTYDEVNGPEQDFDVRGSGELEICFGERAEADIEIDWSRRSVVLKPGASAHVEVVPNGNLHVDGEVDFDVLKRSISTHATLGFTFPNKARMSVSHGYGPDGHQLGFSLKVQL